MSEDDQPAQLPLADASHRLRSKPERPRKAPVGKSPVRASTQSRADRAVEPTSRVHQASVPFAAPPRMGSSERDVPGTYPIVRLTPRLLDLPGAAAYLGLSPWTVRDLEAARALPRVRVPLPNGGELRKLLFDREDLDRLIAAWKDEPSRRP
jgi:hypothetical protein